MGFFKITPKPNAGQPPRPRYVHHDNGSQKVYDEVESIAGLTPHTNGIPLALEADGWADDQACIGDERDYGAFTIECISEEQFRKETDQKDTPASEL